MSFGFSMIELENIQADAQALQLLLEMEPSSSGESCSTLQAARNNCKCILEICERNLKSMKLSAPPSVTPSAPECKDANEKARVLLEQE